ncbi:hypothetical protein [Kaarinaea lacus]
MIKTNAENMWLELDVVEEKHAARISVGPWISKGRNFFRHLFRLFRVAPGKVTAGIISTFIINDEQKSKDAKRNIKDEFYFRKFEARRNIPHRTWKRHSALLHYHQQQTRQQQVKALSPGHESDFQAEAVTEAERQAALNIDTPAVNNLRLSFRVKSIRLLPIWASALSDLSLIEDDLSSLRFYIESSPDAINIGKAA